LDRLLDIICFLLVFLLALTLEFDTLYTYMRDHSALFNNEVSSKSLFVSPLFWLLVTAVGIIVILFQIREYLYRHHFFLKMREIAKGFFAGVKSIKQTGKPWLLVFHSIFIWLMYYAMTYTCFLAFAPTSTLGPLVALMVYVFGSLGMIIPSPGGLGSYHFLVIAALGLYGINNTDAFSFSNIMFFTINIFYVIALGIWSLFAMNISNRDYVPHHYDVSLHPDADDPDLDSI